MSYRRNSKPSFKDNAITVFVRFLAVLIAVVFVLATFILWASTIVTGVLLIGWVLSLLGIVATPAGTILGWAGYGVYTMLLTSVIYVGVVYFAENKIKPYKGTD